MEMLKELFFVATFCVHDCMCTKLHMQQIKDLMHSKAWIQDQKGKAGQYEQPSIV